MRRAVPYLIRLGAMGIAGLGLYLLNEELKGPVLHTSSSVLFFACFFVAFWLMVGTIKGGRFNPRKS